MRVPCCCDVDSKTELLNAVSRTATSDCQACDVIDKIDDGRTVQLAL